MSVSQFLTAAFYKFVDLPDYAERRAPLLGFCEEHGVKGLILLAREGINSTIAGAPQDVHTVLNYLRRDPLLEDMQHIVSRIDEIMDEAVNGLKSLNQTLSQ